MKPSRIVIALSGACLAALAFGCSLGAPANTDTDTIETSAAPAYDASGNTSLVAANLLFEMLCALPGVEHR